MICIRVSACWSRQQSSLIGSVLKSNPKSGIKKTKCDDFKRYLIFNQIES